MTAKVKGDVALLAKKISSPRADTLAGASSRSRCPPPLCDSLSTFSAFSLRESAGARAARPPPLCVPRLLSALMVLSSSPLPPASSLALALTPLSPRPHAPTVHKPRSPCTLATTRLWQTGFGTHAGVVVHACGDARVSGATCLGCGIGDSLVLSRARTRHAGILAGISPHERAARIRSASPTGASAVVGIGKPCQPGIRRGAVQGMLVLASTARRQTRRQVCGQARRVSGDGPLVRLRKKTLLVQRCPA